MCGIGGVVSLKGIPEEESAVVKNMMLPMAHRGPDDEGSYCDEYAMLGFRRLSIIDRKTGRQPLSSEDSRYHLIFNGEIYNFQQLRRELQAKGHRFRTRSDAEVVVHLYEDLGVDCLHKLRGMFALAIWDKIEKRLFLARDRFGIKPLYYTLSGEKFIFGSELKALLKHPSVEAKFNQAALPHYLTFQYFPDPETAFKGLYRLRPAHYLILDQKGLRLKKYWYLKFRPDYSQELPYFIEMTDYLLQESVRLHMISDVPRGAFLSSGIDSSNIVALLNRMERVNTYSVGCEGGKFDELPQARQTAAFLGTRHKEIKVGPMDFWNNLPMIIWFQDEPVSDPAAIALYFVAKLAASDVKVVLSGEGADEVFGGYDIYREPAAVAPLQHLPSPLKRLLHRSADRLPDGLKGKSYLRRATSPLEQRYFGNALIFSEKEKKILLNRELFGNGWDHPTVVTEPYYKQSRRYDSITRMQHLDFCTWLPGDILTKADRMTMAHSLELRVPYLDHVLFEFAATIPPCYKIRQGMTKFILRQASAKYLPAEVCRRPKLGFPVPIAAWIKNSYRPQLQELFQSRTAACYFQPEILQRMLQEHCADKADYGRKLWTVTIFLLWHQKYLQTY